METELKKYKGIKKESWKSLGSNIGLTFTEQLDGTFKCEQKPYIALSANRIKRDVHNGYLELISNEGEPPIGQMTIAKRILLEELDEHAHPEKVETLEQ